MTFSLKKLITATISFILVFTLLLTGCQNDKSNPQKNNNSGNSESEIKNESVIFEDLTESGELDIVSNIFTDSLVYTGYNLKKHNADGLRWTYILARDKGHRNWLSKIGYGGGSSGYETTEDGKPDIKYFERYGLVCASFVTYVYFNYLPNVAGIDTSSLTKPVDAWNADHWYDAALDWVDKGYSELIPFEAKINYGKHIKFKAEKDIPIGSIMVFRKTSDKRKDPRGGHVAIYAGYKNGNHWVIHVGNDNGPEFCAVERMNCDPIDPHWPLAVISAPKHIRFGAALQVAVHDQNGNPINDVSFTLKDTSGKSYSLPNTNNNGNTILGYMNYIDLELTVNVPDGYTCKDSTQKIKLSSKNNSLNRVSFTLNKK